MSFSIYLFLLLMLILSMDAFTAGLSYGMSGVYVPFFSVLIVALLSGCMLTLSLYAGDLILALIPAGLTKAVSFSVLFLLSLYKFYDALPNLRNKRPHLTTDNISQAINSTDPSVLSAKEAFVLGLALSIDNISAGLCTGTQNIPAGILLPATTLIHICMIRLGLYTGHILAHKGLDRFSWLGAAILMGLAFLRLL